MMHPRHTVPMLAAVMFLCACATPAAPTLTSQAPSVTPEPPTATVTASPLPPSATPTLAAAPRTFTEGFDAAAPHWQFLQGGAVGEAIRSTVQSGTLRLELPGPDRWAYGLYAGPQYDDVRVDAVVDFGPGAGSSAGVICRYDAGLGWYEFDIYPDRSYSILFGQWLADGIARYTPLVLSESEHISATVNEIGLVCQGSILTPYVNATQLRRRQETQHVLTTGQVGLSASSSDVGGQVISFDWVSVGVP